MTLRIKHTKGLNLIEIDSEGPQEHGCQKMTFLQDDATSSWSNLIPLFEYFLTHSNIKRYIPFDVTVGRKIFK